MIVLQRGYRRGKFVGLSANRPEELSPDRHEGKFSKARHEWTIRFGESVFQRAMRAVDEAETKAGVQ